MKKGVIIFCLTVYIFASVFVFPVYRVSANPLAVAVPAGIEIGAGVYVTGAIALAALAGAFGYTQYKDDIREHAAAVWASASDTVKKSLRASIEAAVAAGKKTISISKDVYDFIVSKVGFITSAIRNASPVKESFSPELVYSPYGSADFRYSLAIELSPARGYRLIHYYNGKPYNAYNYGGSVFRIEYDIGYDGDVYVKGFNSKVRILERLQPVSIVGVIAWYNSVMSPQHSLELVPINSVDTVFSSNIKSSGLLSWDETTDTPSIVLPSTFPAVSSSGKTLTWDPDARVWKDASGVAVPQSDVIVKSPELVLGNDGIAYKDVATGKLVGVKEGTIADAPPAEHARVKGGAGILDDILTGVRAIADVLTTGLIGDTSRINWDKLKMAGSAFTTAFPFSIPWDVGRAFDAVFSSFNDLKNTPEWEWKINFLGQQYPIRFKIDDYFLEWFSIIRSVMLIMFDVGLIYAVRKMLGGAS